MFQLRWTGNIMTINQVSVSKCSKPYFIDGRAGCQPPHCLVQDGSSRWCCVAHHTRCNNSYRWAQLQMIMALILPRWSQKAMTVRSQFQSAPVLHLHPSSFLKSMVWPAWNSLMSASIRHLLGGAPRKRFRFWSGCSQASSRTTPAAT